MPSKSLVRNYICDFLYRILTIITPIITAPYISRIIGADGIGDYSYTQSICSYFALAAILGSNVYGQREIAFCCNDKDKRSYVFWEIMCIRVVTIVASSSAYMLLCIHSEGKIKILLLLQLVDILGLLFDITWLLQGVEEFGIILYRNIIIKVLSVLSIFLFVKNRSDLYLYVFLTSIAVVAGNISVWPQVGKFICFVPWKKLHIKRHLTPILSLFLPTIALRLYDAFDKTMLGMIVGLSSENGYYEQALKIITMAITVVTSLGNVMAPRMAVLHSQKNKEKLASYLYSSFEITWALALPISFGIMAVAGNLIPWFLGEGYGKVIILLRCLAIICIAMGMKNVIGLQYLVPTERQKQYTKSILFGLGVNVVLNMLLIPRYQSIGAVMASVISEYFIVCVQLFMIRKEIRVGGIFNTIQGKLISAIIMGVIIYFLSEIMPAAIFSTLILICVGVIVYFSMLLLFKDISIIKLREMVNDKLKK